MKKTQLRSEGILQKVQLENEGADCKLKLMIKTMDRNELGFLGAADCVQAERRSADLSGYLVCVL